MFYIRTVLFDLDGTLIDTAPDMAMALNILREEEGLEALPFQQIRPVVSNGSLALVELGFGSDLAPERREMLKQRYLEIYQDNLHIESRLFEGMDTLLSHIEERGMLWGVVTNKPGWLTDPLMASLNLTHRAACIVSGDTTPHRKPHPEPMFHACRQAGTESQHCIYIGDAKRDIEAGKNASMKTLIAAYGYIGNWEQPENWGADGCIQHPNQIIGFIENLNTPSRETK